MADFSTNKYRCAAASDTEAERVAEVLSIANLETILLQQQALEKIQKAIEAGTIPSVKPTLAQINTALAAELIP